MIDPVFGELEFDGCGYWNGRISLDFFGKPCDLSLMIDSCYESQTEISDCQRETYRTFLEKWPELQETVVKELIRYYNEEDRFSCGPDDPEEFAAWWPEIDTVEEMVKWVELETVVIESDSIAEDCRDGKRCLYLLFSREWAEDVNGYGVGIRLLDEEIDKTGHQSIAF